MKIKNRFYVASDNVLTAAGEQTSENFYSGGRPEARPWAKATLDDAIKHAKAVLESKPHLESVAVVKIIRLVERESPPMVVRIIR